MTVSEGVTISHEEDSIDSLLNRADKLMYESKRNGRNRITFG
ncbi:MAG: GGDEF domain-containing protein [Spirochaetota bacterium]